MALFIEFGGFIYGIYLLALVLAYTVSIHFHSNLIQIFALLRKEHLYISFTCTYLTCFPLRHHTHLIKLTLLQLHHRTSLIKLTNITSLHHNYNTCSILTLHFSNITSHYSESIHLQIPSDIQLLRLSSIFISLTQRCTSHSILTTYGILRNYCFSLATSKLIQDRDQSTKTQCSAPYVPAKLMRGSARYGIYLLQRKMQCTLSPSL